MGRLPSSCLSENLDNSACLLAGCPKASSHRIDHSNSSCRDSLLLLLGSLVLKQNRKRVEVLNIEEAPIEERKLDEPVGEPSRHQIYLGVFLHVGLVLL